MSEIIPFENWYAEPFTKRKTCQTPGQCDENCDCGCPYNTMTDLEKLPLIEELAEMFPNEWLAFVISAAEEDDLVPTHGKLVAHSPNPDELFDAVNTVLWNQCVYTFFNGSFEAMQASYGDQWDAPEVTDLQPVITFGYQAPPPSDPVPDKLLDLVYSALDYLYKQPPNIQEAIRRLRIAKIRASHNPQNHLLTILDNALDGLETPIPVVSKIIWDLEEHLSEFELTIA